MKVENLKELKALLKVCNEHGVRSITIDGINMLIEPNNADLTAEQQESTNSTDTYTDEQLLMWSAQPQVG